MKAPIVQPSVIKESKKNMDIKENLTKLKNSFRNPDCQLIAVSKTKSVEDILEAYNAGVRDFGENKVQEMMEKQPLLPADIRWHMIGHLQRNKVRHLAPFVHLIQGVDSLKLLRAIDKEGKKINRVLSCLLQVHIGREESKFGFDENELIDVVKGEGVAALTH